MSPSDSRDPLGPISLNHTSNIASSSTPSTRKYIAPKDRPLASIFTQKRRLLSSPMASSSTHPATSSPPEIKTPHAQGTPGTPPRKRVKLSLADEEEDVSMDVDGTAEEKRKRDEEVTRYFMPTTPTRGAKRVRYDGAKEVPEVKVVQPEVRDENIWVRPRRRMGVAAYRGTMTSLDRMTPTYTTHPPYLTTLTYSLTPFLPEVRPSQILLPSLHPPTGRARDFAPALCVQFSNTAKRHTAASAQDLGLRRMMAVAGEEGGMRIVDVDAPQGHHRESGGWWWRAHANAIFDTKWSDDDSKIMTTSGDQTTRIHALDAATPTLLYKLRGHTSSIKTATFFDPSRANHGTDASKGSIVATAGRDGNVLIFDLRCAGKKLAEGRTDEYDNRSTGRERDRYSAGIPGFSPATGGEEIDPVMVIKNAHGEPGRRSSSRTSIRSVTSLIALQSMPGILASGGSADSIVKLWDLRFPTPTTRYPDPRPSHSHALYLPDPTTTGYPSSRRPRGIHSLAESPTSGDIHALCGDSKIHTLRPSYALPSQSSSEDDFTLSQFNQAILPTTYASDHLQAQSFFIRMSLSPDGRYLAAGSGKGGVVAFDTLGKGEEGRKGMMFKLEDNDNYWPEGRSREVSGVDWGMGCLAACADDRITRVWRSLEDGSVGGVKEEKNEWGSVGCT